jgi:hypothetical protein
MYEKYGKLYQVRMDQSTSVCKVISNLIILCTMVGCTSMNVKNDFEPGLFSLHAGSEITRHGLSLKYISFGHEHCSSSPDEPFSAAVGVYCFEVSDLNGWKQEFTLCCDVNNHSDFTVIKNNKIFIRSVSEDQKILVICIEKFHNN